MSKNTEVNKKIVKARASLIIDAPFFATIALRRKMIESEQCIGPVSGKPTMATDGESIIYHPEFVKGVSLDELKGVICHEVLHISNLHTIRRQSRDHVKWNIAADFAINGVLLDSGFALPKGCLHDKQFDGKSAEQIYNALPPGQKGGTGKQENAPEWGWVNDQKKNDGSQLSESELRQIEQEIKIEVNKAKNIAKNQGKMPAGLQRLIDEFLEPVINWREVLSRFLVEIVTNDYTWRSPNKRYAHFGLYLPSLKDPDLGGEVGYYCDTSGSISHDEMKRIGSEIQGILNTFNNIKVHTIFCDSAFQGHQEFDGYDDVKSELEPKGGGGTDFRPPFKYVEKNNLDVCCAVYLTDGYCNSFPKNEPSYPVLWLLTVKNKNFEPPFGEVIWMEN